MYLYWHIPELINHLHKNSSPFCFRTFVHLNVANAGRTAIWPKSYTTRRSVTPNRELQPPVWLREQLCTSVWTKSRLARNSDALRRKLPALSGRERARSVREGKKRDWGHNLCPGRFALRERERDRERERERKRDGTTLADSKSINI